MDIATYQGLYSVVQAADDTLPDAVIVERALTPTPKYGKRTFTRSDPTLDAGDWAQEVLDDRAFPGLQWVPGDVYPLDANAVEYYATLEAGELVSLLHEFTEPAVIQSLMIVGGEIRITAKADDSARWRFTFEAAQLAEQPLLDDVSDPREFLLSSAGDEYLYPDT